MFLKDLPTNSRSFCGEIKNSVFPTYIPTESTDPPSNQTAITTDRTNILLRQFYRDLERKKSLNDSGHSTLGKQQFPLSPYPMAGIDSPTVSMINIAKIHPPRFEEGGTSTSTNAIDALNIVSSTYPEKIQGEDELNEVSDEEKGKKRPNEAEEEKHRKKPKL